MPAVRSSIISGYGFRGVEAAPALALGSMITESLSMSPLDLDWQISASSSLEEVCFPAGTMIYLSDGTCKTVEEIADKLLLPSVSDRSPEGPISMGEVVEVIRNGASDLVAVEFGGRVVPPRRAIPSTSSAVASFRPKSLPPAINSRTVSGAPMAVTSVSPAGRASVFTTSRSATCIPTSSATPLIPRCWCITITVPLHRLGVPIGVTSVAR